jgi:hypothetical protein
MPQAPLSFCEFANRILIALSEKPGDRLDLKQLAESNGFRYKEGWIARVSEYLAEKGWITVNKLFRHYKSDTDGDYYAVVTGVGLIEAEKLQSSDIVDQQERQSVDREF